MLSYIKQHIFAKIALVFFIASIAIVVFSYNASTYWLNLQKDDMIDAHEAYFQYKLIESWGVPPDTALIRRELSNLHIEAMIYHMDGDTTCENDSLVLWTNMDQLLPTCNYLSYLDSDMLGESYKINYDEWVSFGEIALGNRLLQTTYIEFSPFKYYLISSHVVPWDFYVMLPPLFLVLLLMGVLFFFVRRFLLPLNLIEKRIVSLEGGDLDSSVPIVGSDELANLSRNFNQLVLDIKELLKQKERLLSDVSHELRTPLAKIKLAVAMLPSHDKTHSIDKQIKTLDSLITNILLSDKMASAYSNLKLEECNVRSLIDKSLELTSIKNVNISVSENFSFKIDIVKVSIALKNLIENAYKYSPSQETIIIKAYEKNNYLVVAVFDSGPGVPEDQLEKITKAFVRLPGSGRSGFGLGLSICHKVMSAHSGKLDIANNKGGGSCFALCFPV